MYVKNLASTFVCIHKTKEQITVSKNILFKKRDILLDYFYIRSETNYNLKISFTRLAYKTRFGFIAYRDFLIGYR